MDAPTVWHCKVKASVALVVCLAVLSYVVAAQQAPDSAPGASLTIHKTTHLVVLDVVVTDQSGRAVNSLAPDSFTVLEDGVAQKIVSFENPESHYNKTLQQRGVGNLEGNPDSTPRNILVIDELNTDPINGARARDAVKKYLRAQRSPLRQPTALLILGNHGLTLLQSYTTDHKKLAQAMAAHKPELPWHLLHAEGVRGAGWRFGMMVRALEQIAQASVNRSARKNVIWLSTGYPVLSLTHMFGSDIEKLNGLITALSKMLMESRISVYTIDPSGISGNTESEPSGRTPFGFFGGSSLVNGALIFERIAPETGGKICHLRNDISDCIGDDAVDGASYYTLAYYPSNANWNGKFRHIAVKVNATGIRARTRLGYFAVSDPEGISDAQIDFTLSMAVTNPITYIAVPFGVAGKHLTTPDQAELTFKIDQSGLWWSKTSDGGSRTEITLVTAGINRDEKVLGYKVREFEVTLPKPKKSKSDKGPVVLKVVVDVPPKADRIRCVVRDAQTDHLGTIDLQPDTLTVTPLSQEQPSEAN